MIRNLIFYCYPIQGKCWPWHAEQIEKRRSLWNGRRILVISLDDRTESEKVVRESFAALDAEVLVRKNDSELGEAAHFIEALGLLESSRDDEATFYAHAKGVTRTKAMLQAVLKWSDLMYRASLDFPLTIEQRLLQFPTVGCLRWKHEPPRKRWCFAGTFFWLRHSEIFGRDWRKISREYYGVEDYPGKQFKIEEGFCLTPEQIHPVNLYGGSIDENFTRKVLESLEKEERTTRESTLLTPPSF